jgi:hypothetical protein
VTRVAGETAMLSEMSTEGVATAAGEKDREKIDEIPEAEWKQRVNVSHNWQLSGRQREGREGGRCRGLQGAP